MITKATLEKAIIEAQRFILFARAAKESAVDLKENELIWGNKHTGAARRASMDLSRVLANFRRGK